MINLPWNFMSRRIIVSGLILLTLVNVYFILFPWIGPITSLYFNNSDPVSESRLVENGHKTSLSLDTLTIQFKYRQVMDDSQFLAPIGIPKSPSFDRYSLEDELSAYDADENENARRRLHFSNYLYRGYEDFVNHFGLEKDAKKAPLSQKCNAFFELLTQSDPDWEIRPIHDHEWNVDDKNEVLNNIKDELKRDWERENTNIPFKLTVLDEYYIQKKFEDRIKATLKGGQAMADASSIVRIFGNCFFNEDSSRDMITYKRYSKKVYSYLSDSLPSYRHSSLETCLEGALPVFDSQNEHTGKAVAYISSEDIFLEFLRTNLSGRGIVISANNNYEREVMGLIRVLRATNNRLPIQIVHRGDLDRSVQDAIHIAATESMNDMFNRPLNDREKRVLPHIDLLKDASKYGAKYPAQNVWFVDITPSLSPMYREKFSRFGNKILALFLNSFAEVLFMDADTVPLISTEELFLSPEYLQHGNFIFKDRTLTESSSYMQVVTVLRLFPINERSIDTLFGIPLVTNKTLSNEYLLGWYHTTESGLVLLDRKRHFLANLLLTQMGFWEEISSKLLYGDKEWFWMAFAMAGGEEYAMNKYSAGSVGKSWTRSKVLWNPDSGSRSVLGSHPGHVNAEGKLLWINSGMLFCKKCDWEDHLSSDYYKDFALEDLKQLFIDPVPIEAVVVPPQIPANFKPRIPWTSAENSHREEVKRFLTEDRKKDHLLDGQPLKASQKNWVQSGGCQGYDHVAFDKVVSYDENTIYDFGEYFEFDQETVLWHNYLGKVWLNLGHKKE